MFKEKVAVVTGGSRGIGKAIATKLGELDCKVIILYAGNTIAAEETSKSIANSICYKVDISNPEEVEKVFKEIILENKKIDILVNNAGITRDNLLMRMKISEWDDVVDTNLKGVFLCTKSVIRTMLKQRYGRIINITSVVGQTGNIGQGNYSAAKAGVIGLTKTTARELASKGITVNAVAPGYIKTDMTSVLNESAKESMLDNIPVGREGLPEEVAELVCFLASEKSKYITGQVINVDGGLAI